LSTHLRLGFPSGFLSFWLSRQYPICIPLPPCSCYMPCPSHPPSLDHSNYVWREVQVMKLRIMQFYPISCHFNSFWDQMFSWAPCSQTPSVCVPPLMSETKFPTCKGCILEFVLIHEAM
jgi:hypothetical protein